MSRDKRYPWPIRELGKNVTGYVSRAETNVVDGHDPHPKLRKAAYSILRWFRKPVKGGIKDQEAFTRKTIIDERKKLGKN